MNAFDYFFSHSKDLKKNFCLSQKEQISFNSLYINSLAIAGYLKNTIGTKKNIILISHNNLFFIESYLGILKSGNTVIPLNPVIESDNLNYIIQQCESDFIFADNKVAKKLNNTLKIINEQELEKIISLQIPFIDVDFESEDIAEIIFTSGSTGLPKGVVLSHKNLITNTSSIIQYLKLNSNDIMLVILPFYYCYGLSLLHTHLTIGGSIVINNSFIFIGGIFKDLNQYKCTGFAGVPSHYQLLLRKSKSFKTTEFPYLKYVTQAGGKLSSIFINEFKQAFPNIKFYVMYGQTEATARLSYLPPELLNEKPESIGKGIPNVTLRVVNQKMEDVKTGENGEIIAQGDNIMKEYYKDADLTSQTIKNGWLYTGDIAKIDQDGYIYIISRKKEIIKVGGKRVSPKEIEEVILMIPSIIDCTVSGVEDPILGEAIKVSIIINENNESTITKQDIQNHCYKYLAKYKIPTYIEFEKNIQISATGKKIKPI